MILREEPTILQLSGGQAPSPVNVEPLTKSDVKFIKSMEPVMLPPKDADGPALKTAPIRFQQDAPSCSDCGSIMVRKGACYKCLNCGSTSGCS